MRTIPSMPALPAAALRIDAAIGGFFFFGLIVQWIGLLLNEPGLGRAPWAEAIFWLSAALVSLERLQRRLPLQNVIMTGLVMGGMAIMIGMIGAHTGTPFGRFTFNETWALPMAAGVAWIFPLIWITVIVTGRGVARLILRPWRRGEYYGFGVALLTALLALFFNLAFQPFATDLKGYWSWPSDRILPWHSAPWTNFLGWYLSALAILTFSTPWLIPKKPVPHPPDYFPLGIWGLLQVTFCAADLIQGYWTAGVASLVLLAATAALALRGGKDHRDTKAPRDQNTEVTN